MIRRFIPLALSGAALSVVAAVPAHAMTKPKTQVPAESRPQARAIVRQLLREGKIMRSSDVRRGMIGVGRSVFQGTKIETFKVVVLGTLSRVQGGADIVLIKVLDGPVVKRQTGIIAGMSGSPVYINGKMLGAIALGWGFPKEPIGGVTPITQMIETSLPDPSRRKIVSPSGKTAPAPKVASFVPDAPLTIAGRNITRVDVSRDPKRLALSDGANGATMTMRPVSTLLQISGATTASLPGWKKIYGPYGIEPMIGPEPMIGMASKKSGVKPPFTPGGAIGVQLVSGDMDQTAIGTVTFRWGNRILAFGHPMFGQGAASMPMTSAYVLDVFPSYQRSFKLASPVAVVGALQQDTQFAIGGTVGMTADTIPMTVALHDRERSINKTYRVRVMKDPVLTPQLIGAVASEAMETTLGLTSDKMVRVGLKMQIDGAPAIVRRNLIYASDAIQSAALMDLGQTLAVTQMNEFARGSVRRVDLDVSVEAVRKTARIKQISANRNTIKAGQDVQVKVVLETTYEPDKTVAHTFTFHVPGDAPDGQLRIAAATGADYWPLQTRVGGAPPEPTNLKELVSAWSKVGAFNQLQVQASTTRTYLKIDRQKVFDPAPSFLNLLGSSRSTSVNKYNEVEVRKVETPFMLSGAQFLDIKVESVEHPTKTGASPDASTSAAGAATPDESSGESSGTPPDAPPPSDGDDSSDGSSSTLPASLRSLAMRPFNGDQTFGNSSFLNQIKQLQGAQNMQTRVVPRRVEPQRPVTPSITSPTPNPSPQPSPSASPIASPTPEPTMDASKLARPAQSWVQSGAASFISGKFESAVVTNAGEIRAAPPSKLLATTSETFAWSIAGDNAGNTFIGTGNLARIIKIAPNGKATTFYSGPEVAITALACDNSGNVYAGVSPGAKIYQFTPDGRKIEFFQASGQSFVWALNLRTQNDASSLLIATGGRQGKLYEVPDLTVLPAGARSEPRAYRQVASVPQKHIRALATRGEEIFMGTGQEGVLYRVANGQVAALYQASDAGGKDAQETEVLAVAAGPEGVYFGTSKSGTLYRWTQSDGVISLYPSPQKAVYAMQRDAKGVLYVATGDDGIVYRVEPGQNSNDTRAARLLEPKQQQSLSLALSGAGDLLVGTGNNAAAYRVALNNQSGGSFTSDVFDAKNVVQWGALRVTSQGATIETHSGNTVDPDASWSAWQPAATTELGELRIASPAARYLQYRVRLSGASDASAATTSVTTSSVPEAQVSRVEVVYRARNSAPTVALSAPRGGEFWSKQKKVTWAAKDDDSDTLRYRLFISKDDGKTYQPVALEDASTASFTLDTTKFGDGVYRLKVEASDAVRNPDDPRRDEAISLPFTIDNTAPTIEAAGVRVVSSADGPQLQATITDTLSPIAGADAQMVNPNTPKATPKAAPDDTKKAAAPATTNAAITTAPITTAITPAKTEDSGETKKDPTADDYQTAAAQDGIFDSRRETVVVVLKPAGGAATATGVAIAGTQIRLRAHDAAGNTATLLVPAPANP